MEIATLGDPFLWMMLGIIGGGLLAFDIWYHKDDHVMGVKESAIWSCFYVAAAIAFGLLVYTVRGSEDAAKYFTGYTLEKVLSLDNVMVFGVIFAYFGIKPEHRHWILHWGILGAIVLRLLFAAFGVGMLKVLGAPMLLIFAGVVLFTAWKLLGELRGSDDDEEIDYDNAWYIRLTKRILGDRVTSETNGHALFINGAATPLFFCLVAIEVSDVMFALDSIPAIIAVTQDTLLVYAAMMFAILGLRALFFLLEALLERLTRLSYALLLVLVWIGVKMIGQAFEEWHLPIGFHVDPMFSLWVVLGLLGGGVVASLIWPAKETQAE